MSVYRMRDAWHNRELPYATLTILFLNVACFLVESVLGESKATLMFCMYAHALSVGPAAWYRIVTNAFMHFGVLHLLCNMLALYSYGMALERAIGWWRYVILYAAGIVGGALMVNFFGGNGLHMGASSALWGLMAALLVLVLKRRGNLESILRCLVLNIVITFAFANISWQGHVGGGIGGAVAALILFSFKTRRQRAWEAARRRAEAIRDDENNFVR